MHNVKGTIHVFIREFCHYLLMYSSCMFILYSSCESSWEKKWFCNSWKSWIFSTNHYIWSKSGQIDLFAWISILPHRLGHSITVVNNLLEEKMSIKKWITITFRSVSRKKTVSYGFGRLWKWWMDHFYNTLMVLLCPVFKQTSIFVLNRRGKKSHIGFEQHEGGKFDDIIWWIIQLTRYILPKKLIKRCAKI